MRDRAGLRVRHQATRAEHAAELADLTHQVGRRDRDVEVEEAALDPLHEIVGADDVGARGLGLAGRVALGEHGDPRRSSRCRRQRHRAAEHLVGLAGVDPEPERDLDRLVELRLASDFTSSNASAGGCSRSRSYVLAASCVLLAVLVHSALVLRSRRPLLAGSRSSPAEDERLSLVDDVDSHRPGGARDLDHRAFDVDGVQVGHLRLRDLADLRLGDLADLLGADVRRALLDARGLAQQHRASAASW